MKIQRERDGSLSMKSCCWLELGRAYGVRHATEYILKLMHSRQWELTYLSLFTFHGLSMSQHRPLHATNDFLARFLLTLMHELR